MSLTWVSCVFHAQIEDYFDASAAANSILHLTIVVSERPKYANEIAFDVGKASKVRIRRRV